MFTRKVSITTGVLFTAVLSLLAACSGDDGGDGVAFDLRSEVVATAERVSDIVFAPDGRIFFAEQLTGNIRVIQADGTVQEEPFATLDVATYIDLDWGLTGLALDPDFETNGYVYAFYTQPDTESENRPTAHPTIVRFTDEDGVGEDETVITDDFPQTSPAHPGYNANGKIHLGPDGFLYASIGDYDDPENLESVIQRLSSPVSALLRLDPEDGTAPDDNPFADDPNADPRVYAYGFREPFDFAFHPETAVIYGTDNTTVSCEELNIIEPGANYGWPAGEFPYDDCRAGEQGRVIHHFAREGMEPENFLSFVEVSGLAFVPGSRYPSLGDSLVVCESWRSVDAEGTQQPGVLRRLVLGGQEFDQVTSSDVIVRDCRGTVAAAPDGSIYYANDTEIRRLEADTAEDGDGGDGGGDGNGDAGDPTQPIPPPMATP